MNEYIYNMCAYCWSRGQTLKTLLFGQWDHNTSMDALIEILWLDYLLCLSVLYVNILWLFFGALHEQNMNLLASFEAIQLDKNLFKTHS